MLSFFIKVSMVPLKLFLSVPFRPLVIELIFSLLHVRKYIFNYSFSVFSAVTIFQTIKIKKRGHSYYSST